MAYPPRALPNEMEHVLQTHVNAFQREAILEPHTFLAFDRSKARGKFTHAREKARGMRSGTCDTVTLVAHGSLWVELKYGDNTADENQLEVMDDINRLKVHRARVAYSVAQYMEHCSAFGIALHPRAALMAEHKDLLVESARMKREKKAGKVPTQPKKPREFKPSAAKVRRMESLRMKIPF